MVHQWIDLAIYNVVLTKTETYILQSMYIFKHTSICFVFLIKYC